MTQSKSTRASETGPLADSANDWRADDWESARSRKLTLGLAATPSERLAWLEAMIRVAWASGALPRPRDASGRVKASPE